MPLNYILKDYIKTVKMVNFTTHEIFVFHLFGLFDFFFFEAGDSTQGFMNSG